MKNSNPVILTLARIHRRTSFTSLVFLGLIFTLLLFAKLLVEGMFGGNDQDIVSLLRGGIYSLFFSFGSSVLWIWTFSSIYGAVQSDFESGMYAQTHLTPLRPLQVISGYLLGPSGALLVNFTLFAVVTYFYALKVEVSLISWVQAILLVMSTGLLLGIGGFALGMSNKKSWMRPSFMGIGVVLASWVSAKLFPRFIGSLLIPPDTIAAISTPWDIDRSIRIGNLSFFGVTWSNFAFILLLQLVCGFAILFLLRERVKRVFAGRSHILYSGGFYLLILFLQVAVGWSRTDLDTTSLPIYLALLTFLYTLVMANGIESVEIEDHESYYQWLPRVGGYPLVSGLLAILLGISTLFIYRDPLFSQPLFWTVPLYAMLMVFVLGVWVDFCRRFLQAKRTSAMVLGILVYFILPLFCTILFSEAEFSLFSPVGVLYIQGGSELAELTMQFQQLNSVWLALVWHLLLTVSLVLLWLWRAKKEYSPQINKA